MRLNGPADPTATPSPPLPPSSRSRLRRTSGPVSRRLPYLVLGLTLLLIAGFAVQQTLRLQQEFLDEEARQDARTLLAMIAYWEAGVLRQSRAALRELESGRELAATEQRLRAAAPWLDAIYVWTPDARSPRMLYPDRPETEDPGLLLKHPCLARADRTLRLQQPTLIAAAFRACRDTPASYHLLSSSMAALMYLQIERPRDAWVALSEVDTPLMMPLQEGAIAGMSLSRLVLRRIQGAQAQGQLGEARQQQDLLLDTAREIADLNAPQLEELASYLQYTLPRELKQAGISQGLSALTPTLERAERRIAAYQEISRRLIARAPPAPGVLEIAIDPYETEGFVLVYGLIADGKAVAAVQLDPVALLAELPDMPGMPPRVILDATGIPLEGDAPLSPAALWVQVPFNRLFSHLRVGLLQDTAPRRERRVWLAAQLAPVALAVGLGGLAIIASLRADRRREGLYQRQRDFIARVTHELKTPLTGIRLMAENLELAAEDAPEERAPFVERILQETERLSLRIDEVLRLTQETVAPQKQPIRPHTLAAALVEEWSPRFAEVGGSLQADLPELPELLADQELLRDAVGNLLSNALKYRSPERSLSCTLRIARERRRVLFVVEDNGIGVPVEMREAIFERFTRVEGPGRGLAGGHGLGLAFVAETARAHGGRVRCEPGPDGIGSRFTLRLPLPARAFRRPGPPPPAAPPL